MVLRGSVATAVDPAVTYLYDRRFCECVSLLYVPPRNAKVHRLSRSCSKSEKSPRIPRHRTKGSLRNHCFNNTACTGIHVTSFRAAPRNGVVALLKISKRFLPDGSVPFPPSSFPFVREDSRQFWESVSRIVLPLVSIPSRKPSDEKTAFVVSISFDEISPVYDTTR